MRYGSICSGIEAASCAWHPLGWRAAFVSEIDPFPCAVLAHRYPDVPNFGDMTRFKEWPDAAIDVLVGGTPCQSFSVAGLRKGLADPRGNLMLTFLAIADRYRPRWLVWENVPGVLSSGGGRDFGTFLGGLGELGYGFAYRVLDAQYFGVAQRRRRVFVVGHLGDWRRAAAVLFERHSLQGHPAPRREAGEGAAGTLEARTGSGGFPGTDGAAGGHVVPVCPTLRAGGNRTGGDRPPGTDVDTADSLVPVPHAAISPALKARDSKGASSDGDGDGAILVPMIAHALRGEGFDASEDGTGRGTPLVPVAFDCKASGMAGFGVGEVASTMRSMGHANSHQNGGGHLAVAFQSGQSGVRMVDAHATLDSNNGSRRHNGVVQAMQVRRLTPRECERLQGFPDDYTAIAVRGKPAADGPRYKALGNSMAVPVMAWIGRRIQMVESLQREELAA